MTDASMGPTRRSMRAARESPGPTDGSIGAVDPGLSPTRRSMRETRRNVRPTRRRLAVGAVVLATASTGLVGVATSALFTDTKTITANTFTSGTVSLTATPATTAITMANMGPGDKVTAPITVTNAGAAMRYAVVSVTTEDPLAAQLDLTIKTGVTTCTNGGFDATGVVAYAPGDLGSTGAGTKVIGDALQGSQAGDRALAVSASEVLCAQVTLPMGTGMAFQSLNTTATFTFNAEQTFNNP